MRIRIAVLAAILAAPASAIGRLADVSVIDRDTGRILPVVKHQGEYWVAGTPGAHYAVRIHSHDAQRLLAVTAVDGVNVVTGETASHRQRGYVFSPWQGYDIAGWRKSDSQIAAFTFTSVPESYAARTGRPAQVGVIGVALFRERARPVAPPPAAIQAPAAPPSTLSESRAGRSEPTGEAATAEASKADRTRRAQPEAQSLGTGHGRREHSLVTTVPFERARDTPDEVIRIRYDSRSNLIAMGVLPRPHPPRPRRIDPFPDSRLGYVPDP